MAEGSGRGAVWNAIRLQVLARDGWRCVYCGREANEADHVLPRSKGGSDTLENLVAACRKCNGAKGARVQVRLNYFNNRWLESL